MFTGLSLNLKQTIKSTSVVVGYSGFALNVETKLIDGILTEGNLFRCNKFLKTIKISIFQNN